MLSAAIVVTAKVSWHVATAPSEHVGAVWPVFVALAAFLYVWWLATLLFDLTVIWHWYIRNAQMLERMDEIMGGSRGAARQAPAGRAMPPKLYAPQVQR
jgi:hypothetical protein